MLSRMTWILTAGILSTASGVAAAAPGHDDRPAPAARNDRDGRGDFAGRDGWNGRDHDGRWDRDDRFDVKLYRKGTAEIVRGEKKVRQGRLLLQRAERTRSYALRLRANRLIDQGEAIIRAGEQMQRRARA